MMAAAATRGDITVKNVIPKHLDCLSSKLREIGCEVSEFDDAVRVVCKERLHATSVNTLPYPGFPTDMQPQMSVVLALARGTSVVTESILIIVSAMWMSLFAWVQAFRWRATSQS